MSHHSLTPQLLSNIEYIKKIYTNIYNTVREEFTEHIHILPSPAKSNPNQKFKRDIFTTYGCNGDISALKIATERVSPGNEGVTECTHMDCHNHTRNVFFTNPTEKALSTDLSNLLNGRLREIDRSLRVGTVHTSYARA